MITYKKIFSGLSTAYVCLQARQARLVELLDTHTNLSLNKLMCEGMQVEGQVVGYSDLSG